MQVESQREKLIELTAPYPNILMEQCLVRVIDQWVVHCDNMGGPPDHPTSTRDKSYMVRVKRTRTRKSPGSRTEQKRGYQMYIVRKPPSTRNQRSSATPAGTGI